MGFLKGITQRVKRVVEPMAIEVGSVYHHVDRDHDDLIAYVTVRGVDDRYVYYMKTYKRADMSPARDVATITEFRRFFRPGE